MTLQAALDLQSAGYNVIPVFRNKKAYVKWTAHKEQWPVHKKYNFIRKKWGERGDLNVAIVTGAVSNIVVVDVDSQAGMDALNEFLPDNLITPIASTPGGGWHYYFEYRPGLTSRARVITDCDIRTDGGYIVAPPSNGENGKSYEWLEGLSIFDVKPAPMPDMLFEILRSGAGQASAREHINDSIHYRGDYKGADASNSRTDYRRLQVTTGDFKQGERDQALFHLANTLVKGGMGDENILNYLLFYASHCDPPFPEKEVLEKIQSAKNRNSKADLNISEEIRDYVLTTDGYFLTTDCFNRLQVTTRSEKKAVVAELLRLKNKGIIERHGNKNGCYRRIESDCEPEDYESACTDSVDIWLPFELNNMLEILPGSVILFAGAQDAGKSALQMNIAKENRKKWNVHYFSSELNASAFKNRLRKFRDISIDQWKIKFYPRSENFQDVIKTGPNDLNLIDYLEVHEEFYLVGKHLAQIHKKLGQAIAIVGLQKDPKALYGRGGQFTQDKPILSVSLDHGVATISKFKGEFKGENPRGKQFHFKLVNGSQIIKDRGWHTPIPKT